MFREIIARRFQKVRDTRRCTFANTLIFTPSRFSGAPREKERNKQCVPVVTRRLHSLKRVVLMTTCVSACEKRARHGHARAARTRAPPDYLRLWRRASLRQETNTYDAVIAIRIFRGFDAAVDPARTLHRNKINKASRLLLIRAQCNNVTQN